MNGVQYISLIIVRELRVDVVKVEGGQVTEEIQVTGLWTQCEIGRVINNS